jgi:hypothetical protein
LLIEVSGTTTEGTKDMQDQSATTVGQAPSKSNGKVEEGYNFIVRRGIPIPELKRNRPGQLSALARGLDSLGVGDSLDCPFGVKLSSLSGPISHHAKKRGTKYTCRTTTALGYEQTFVRVWRIA